MTIGRLFPLSFAFFGLTSVALCACSATSGTGSEFSGAGGSGGAASASGGHGGGSVAVGTGGSTGDGLFDAGGGSGGSTGSGNPGCASETQYVYTLDSQGFLYKFDPPTLMFTQIGQLDCPPDPNDPFPYSPYSMAVDRNATAWVVYTNGRLFKVDTKTAACTSTKFVPKQNGFSTFGMGFSSNSPGSSDETLYVSDSGEGTGTVQGLAKIDLSTMTLIPIGKYDKLSARAEMTGTGDARLFGAFEGTPYNVAEIGKSNAKILSQAPQSSINYPANSSNFAFAFWGGDFWLFVGPGSSTDVFHYQPSTGMTPKVKSVGFAIVGAGVSTCAPTKPPA